MEGFPECSFYNTEHDVLIVDNQINIRKNDFFLYWSLLWWLWGRNFHVDSFSFWFVLSYTFLQARCVCINLGFQEGAVRPGYENRQLVGLETLVREWGSGMGREEMLWRVHFLSRLSAQVCGASPHYGSEKVRGSTPTEWESWDKNPLLLPIG